MIPTSIGSLFSTESSRRGHPNATEIGALYIEAMTSTRSDEDAKIPPVPVIYNHITTPRSFPFVDFADGISLK
jgi:hypothetical protein